jgi:benzoate/toluate 1,2-dioxygenase alpha subunit
VFELEMERLWGRAWIYVGHESQVKQAGEFITTTIGTEPVVLSRDKSGQVHVLYNRCGHKGAKVAAQKCGKTSMFRCPYHGWSYHLDGKLNVVPHACSIWKTPSSACSLWRVWPVIGALCLPHWQQMART